MNDSRISRCETEAFALLRRITDPQASDLTTRLNLPSDEIPKGAPATRYAKIWELAKQRGGSTLTELDEILREQQQQPAPLYWLYMSCSEGERDDALCRRFFDDLAKRLQDSFPNRYLRYLDEGNAENPAGWSAWSLRSMRESQVLVCLFSRAFFNSLYCGQVWRAFQNRWEEAYQIAQPAPSCPLVFPVRWGPPDEYPPILPRLARELAIQHANAGSTYADRGLRFLLQQAAAGRGQYKQEYDALLDRFAASLLQMSRDTPLRTDIGVPDLNGIPSAFYLPSQGAPATTPGPGHVKFVFLAGCNPDMDPIRDSGSYGEEPRDWLPYHPESQESIESLSYQAAYLARMNPRSILLDQDLAKNIQAADDKRNVTMMLIDPWSIQLADYGKYAKDYDVIALSWSTVLICWNDADKDTRSFRRKLQEHLRTVLAKKFHARTSEKWRDRIGGIATLRKELNEALISARAAMVDTAAPASVAVGAPFLRPEVIASAPLVAAIDVRSAESENLGLIRQPHVEGPSGGAPA